MLDHLTNEMSFALDELARRVNPNILHWNEWEPTNSYGERMWICLICNNIYNYDSEDLYVITHGMEHLKEHNLLAFT